MKSQLFCLIIILSTTIMVSCVQKEGTPDVKILFLHHSTGAVIWNGKSSNSKKADLPLLLHEFNDLNKTNYQIKEQVFPKAKPYGWKNYPYDYYNIWVKNSGDKPFMEEPTLEILSKEYQVIIFKHCFPVSNIGQDQVPSEIDSEQKTLSNYKLQYNALKDKLNSFQDVKFILFTGAAQVESSITMEEAVRAKEFFDWVKNVWDQSDDNIFIWDLYDLETEGDLFFKKEYAVSIDDSHPNKDFAGKVVKLLLNRIIDVIENNGNKTSLTGVPK